MYHTRLKYLHTYYYIFIVYNKEINLKLSFLIKVALKPFVSQNIFPFLHPAVTEKASDLKMTQLTVYLKACMCSNVCNMSTILVNLLSFYSTISGWTIRPMFDQSSVSWYNCAQSLTTSRNRLNLTLLYVSQYPCILSYFKQFSKLSFNISLDFSRILCLFMSTAIFTGSECFL